MSAHHDRWFKVLTETVEQPTSRIKDADTPVPFRLPSLEELKRRYGPKPGEQAEFGTAARRPTMTAERMSATTLTEAQLAAGRETLRAALTGAETPTTLTEATHKWAARLRGTPAAVPAGAHAKMRRALA